MLSNLGLSPTAEAVYAALTRQSQAHPAELAAALRCSAQEIAAALEELEEATLIRPSRENPECYRAVSFPVALTTLLRNQEAELAQQVQALSERRAAVVEAAARLSHTYDGAHEGTERLIGIDAIETRLETLAQNLEKECLAILPGGAQSQASLDASRPLDEEALARGVSLLNLYDDAMRLDEPTRAYASWLTEHNAQVRTAAVLPPRMLIFDRTVAVVPIDPDNSRAGALLTSEPGIVATLIATFNQAWEQAMPYTDDESSPHETGLSDTQLRLLILLAQGMTDEAAAKRLNIGLRTVRRQMSTIMERINAKSRFEAGVKVAQQGWL